MIALGFILQRLRRYHAPIGALLVLLQRAPVLRLALPGAEYALGATCGQVLKSALGLAALGALDSLAGATTFTVTSSGGQASGAPGAVVPITGTVGRPINGTTGITFSVSGAPVVPKSFGVTDDDESRYYSDSLPPGLAVNPISGLTAGNAPYYNTNTKLTIKGTPTEAGTYKVRLWACDSQAISTINAGYVVAIFTIVEGSGGTDTAPQFTTQPANASVTVGGSVSFSAIASGSPLPTFQWRKGGAPIAGATSSTYAIPSVALSDAGSYSVVATNRVSSVVSVAATLTVNPASPTAPSFVTQPSTQTIVTGASVSFTASATGATGYQWRRNGINLAGATAPTLTIASVATSDAGIYTVVASNGVGSVTSSGATLTVTPRGNIAVHADFNGDLKSDVIWSNSRTGERAIWLMNGLTLLTNSPLGVFPLEWTVAATGDFNGDAKPDLIWSNSSTGERAIWLMNGTSLLGTSTLGIFPLEWTVAATGDFNADGKPDLIWSNGITGERAIWLMNGTSLLGTSTLGTFPLEWTVATTADFNADGKPDIVWSNSVTGERAVWLMNGTNFLASSTLGAFPLEWTVVGSGDFNADGKPDIIWSNSSTGERAIWLMNGTQFLASSTLGTFPVEWTASN